MDFIRTCWNILCIGCLVLCGYINSEWHQFMEEADKEDEVDDDLGDG